VHLCVGTDIFGNNDRDGWTIASMGPGASDIDMNPEAVNLGWKLHPVSPSNPNPALYPPLVPLPEPLVDEKPTKEGEDSTIEAKEEKSETEKTQATTEETPGATRDSKDSP
jgi:hypothetical protein